MSLNHSNTGHSTTKQSPARPKTPLQEDCSLKCYLDKSQVARLPAKGNECLFWMDDLPKKPIPHPPTYTIYPPESVYDLD